jgi:PAS domain-containing protein
MESLARRVRVVLDAPGGPAGRETGASELAMIDSKKTKPENEAARALRESEEKWDALTHNSDDTIVVVDREDVIRYINRTLPSTTPEEVVGRSLYEVAVPGHHRRQNHPGEEPGLVGGLP